MLNLSNLKSNNSKGFTLIELLIVIAILGVLASVVLIAINPGQRINSARNSRVKSDLASIGRTAQVFNTDTGLSSSCTGGASYPNGFSASTTCGATFMATVNDPSATAYVINVPSGCGPNTTTPCTSIAIGGTAFSDGTIDASTLKAWCWRSATGTITQVTSTAAANCAP